MLDSFETGKSFLIRVKVTWRIDWFSSCSPQIVRLDGRLRIFCQAKQTSHHWFFSNQGCIWYPFFSCGEWFWDVLMTKYVYITNGPQSGQLLTSLFKKPINVDKKLPMWHSKIEALKKRLQTARTSYENAQTFTKQNKMMVSDCLSFFCICYWNNNIFHIFDLFENWVSLCCLWTKKTRKYFHRSFQDWILN